MLRKVITGCLVLLGSLAAFAFQHPDRAAVPDLDVRVINASRNSLSAAHEAGVQRLRSRIADLRVGLDVRQPRPSFVSRQNGFLTGPDGRGTAVSKAALQAVRIDDPHRITKAFLNDNPDVFGHDASALTNAVITRDAVGKYNGLRTTVWEQRFEGIPIFESVVVSHVTKNGELVNLSSRFIADPAKVAGLRKPKITAGQAEASAAQSLGETNVMAPDLATKLIWLPMDSATLRLCWDITTTAKSRGETYRLLVDAQTGEVLVRHGLTTYLAATYNVFTSDSPSPFSPGWSVLNTNQPPLAARSLLTLDALSTNASPEGWVYDWSTETFGNNVDAHADRNFDNQPDLPRPQCTIDRVFDFSLDFATQPTNSTDASVVQLFYWCNWMHDQLYELGFDEAAGNFQLDNYDRGGSGGDALQADGQDGSGFNNANMTTPPDGSAPRMQMYLWNYATPNHDGDLDAEIVLHEYTHGLSWRLLNGGAGIAAMQTSGMGEGWSDFYALALLSSTNDDPNGCYAFGAYASYIPTGNNYYYGTRRYPYSTDMAKNPLTLALIAEQFLNGSIPHNPSFTTTAQLNPSEVHNQGEVWCSALWEVRANLIAKHGSAVGNQLALQLVTDGLKLSPPDPNFLQARDAILQADLVDNGGTNRNEIWAGFAKRGMGFSAFCPASIMTAGVVEAFDNGDDLSVAPEAAFVVSGGKGGSFSPACQTYTLTNAGAESLAWEAVHSQAWLDVSPASGVIATGETATVSVCINAAAKALNPGSYTDTLAFSNTLTGAIQARSVALDVLPTERVYYFPFDTDPSWTKNGTWAFGNPKGLGGGIGYGFPDPTSGATGTNVYGVNLNGNYSTAVGAQFNLTSPVLNLTGRSNCVVQFQRWLNSDYSLFVQAEVYLSTNGTSYTRIWANGLQNMDGAWTPQHINIAALADNQPTVYLRWSYRILRTGASPMSGWNIDDVEILAESAPVIVPPRLTIAQTGAGTAVLSWPTNAAGFVLEQNPDLSATNWVEVAAPSTISGTNNQVTIPLEAGGGFFRLKLP